MDALLASYGSDSDDPPPPPEERPTQPERLPPPPLSLLDPPHSIEVFPSEVNRVRSFPHVEGNYALHVFSPVIIPPSARKLLAPFLKKMVSVFPGLHVVEADIPLSYLCSDDQKFEEYVLGREFHISLGRTVPIRVHQIDSIVQMLRQKLQIQRRYWIEFNKWEVFINDEGTRSFISLEVTGAGLSEISKQIQIVNNVYRLHGLPEFYENPRPHISLVWALGNVSSMLKQTIERSCKSSNMGCLGKYLFMCKCSSIECKIGKKSYNIVKVPDQ